MMNQPRIKEAFADRIDLLAQGRPLGQRRSNLFALVGLPLDHRLLCDLYFNITIEKCTFYPYFSSDVFRIRVTRALVTPPHTHKEGENTIMLIRNHISLIAIVLPLMAGLVFGQGLNPLARGLMTASGGLSWAKISYDDEDEGSTLSLTPSWGFFMTDNIQAILGINYTSFKPPEGSSESFSAFVIGGRYYLPLNFGPLYAGARLNTMVGTGAEQQNSLDIQAGYLKFLTRKLALDTGLNYNMGIGNNKWSSLILMGEIVIFFNLPEAATGG